MAAHRTHAAAPLLFAAAAAAAPLSICRFNSEFAMRKAAGMGSRCSFRRTRSTPIFDFRVKEHLSVLLKDVLLYGYGRRYGARGFYYSSSTFTFVPRKVGAAQFLQKLKPRTQKRRPYICNIRVVGLETHIFWIDIDTNFAMRSESGPVRPFFTRFSSCSVSHLYWHISTEEDQISDGGVVVFQHSWQDCGQAALSPSSLQKPKSAALAHLSGNLSTHSALTLKFLALPL